MRKRPGISPRHLICWLFKTFKATFSEIAERQAGLGKLMEVEKLLIAASDGCPLFYVARDRE